MIIILWNKLLINLTQVWNLNAQQRKKMKKVQNPSKKNPHVCTMRYPEGS